MKMNKKKIKPARAWAIVDTTTVMGRWLRVDPGYSICVLAIFRYRKLARLALEKSDKPDAFKIVRVTITVED